MVNPKPSRAMIKVIPNVCGVIGRQHFTDTNNHSIHVQFKTFGTALLSLNEAIEGMGHFETKATRCLAMANPKQFQDFSSAHLTQSS